MIQTLKRIYLYTATTFALLFSAGVTINLLALLLEQAGMRPYDYPPYGGQPTLIPPPKADDVLQAVILWVVGLALVGVAFGGSHYWLLRRDARADPGALGGPARHLYLNGLLVLATLVTIPFALTVLNDLSNGDAIRFDAFPLAFALTGLAVFGLILLERQRAVPQGRAATILRQLAEHVVEVIVLVIGSFTLVNALNVQTHWLLIQNGLETNACYTYGPYSAILVACQPPSVLGPWLQVLFLAAMWGVYVWMGWWDQRSVLRWLTRFAVFGYGCYFLLFGVQQGLSTGAAVVFGAPSAWQNTLNGGLLFAAILATGLVMNAMYDAWIRRAPVQTATNHQARQQGLLGVPAALSLAFALIGVSLALSQALELVVPAGRLPTADDWAQAVGFILAGLGWVPLWWAFQRESDPSRAGPRLPRRGYVLAVLAYTGIGAVAAAAFAIYQLAASLLGLTTADHYMARLAAVLAVVVGSAALAHLQRLRVDLRRLHARQPTPVAAVPVAPALNAVEGIVHEMAVGHLSEAQAAARIHALYEPPASSEAREPVGAR